MTLNKDSLPEKIGPWSKSCNFTGYEKGTLCAMIVDNEIVFGGYRPAGFNLGRIKYESVDDIVDILTEAYDFNTIKDMVRKTK